MDLPRKIIPIPMILAQQLEEAHKVYGANFGNTVYEDGIAIDMDEAQRSRVNGQDIITLRTGIRFPEETSKIQWYWSKKGVIHAAIRQINKHIETLQNQVKRLQEQLKLPD